MSFKTANQEKASPGCHGRARRVGRADHDDVVSGRARPTAARLDRGTRRCRGFSLVEIMVVVVIIGMLAGAVAVGVNKYIDTAKRNRAKSDIATIVGEVEGFYAQYSRYPSSEEGIEVLGLKGGALDPWGKPYEYNTQPGNGEPFEVFTLGQDGREGGEGVDADLFSWQLNEVEGPVDPS